MYTELTVYLPSDSLQNARKLAVRTLWETFFASACLALNYAPSQTKIANMIGCSLGSIKGALGMNDVPASQEILSKTERFLQKHLQSNFVSFEVDKQLAHLKRSSKQKAHQLSPGGTTVPMEAYFTSPPQNNQPHHPYTYQNNLQDTGVLGKRTCHNFNDLGKTFVSEYLQTWRTTTGNPQQRKQLVKEILKAAEARKDELDAECWTPLQVDRCLANLDQKVKNAAKAVAAAAVENNAVEAE